MSNFLILIPTLHEARAILSSAEADSLSHQLPTEVQIGTKRVIVGICGFGLAAAGGGSAFILGSVANRLGIELANIKPILFGIAGSFDVEHAPVGSVVIGTRARCLGIGIGEGLHHRSAENAGWMQGASLSGKEPVGDVISLETYQASKGCSLGEVLSVTTASATKEERLSRLKHSSHVLIEEMEAFSVALAMRLYGLTLTVVRGVSNPVGVRSSLQVKAAAEAGWNVVKEIIDAH